MVAAAGAGSVLAFLARVAIGMDWAATESMMRERLFVVGLDSMLVAVLAGFLASALARGNSGRAFLIGLACGAGPWSWTAFAIAVALVAGLWKFMPKLPAWVTWGGGVLAFALAPLVWLIPATDTLMPYHARPEMAPLAEGVPMPAAGSPDVVMIVCDTLRADDILHPDVPTPNLDALRATGTWSKAAVAPANQTLPSHLSLMFALDIERLGMRSNRSRWPSRRILIEERNAKSLAERFAEAGYRTQAIASNKLLSTTGPGETLDSKQWMGEGFQSWYDVSRQPSTLVYLKWVEYRSLIGVLASHQVVFKKRPLNFFLKRLLIPPSLNLYRLHFQEGETTVAEVQRSLADLTTEERPFFLFANFMEPHDPYLAPPGFAGTIALDKDRPSPFGPGVQGEFKMREQLHVGCLKKDLSVTPEIYLPTGRHLHNRYREEIAYFDTLLGQTIDAIRATGRPTIILFVSDHGEGFGEHAEPAHGHSLHESEIRVPFILNGVGVPQGVELPFAPELVDGSRTLLELAGMNTDSANGRNVLASDFTQRETLSFRNGQVATFDGRWKLIANLEYDHDTLEARAEGRIGEVGAYQLEPVLLYDLTADPKERTNLLAEQPLEVERLLAAIHVRLQGDLYPLLADREFSAQEQADLDALGYGQNGTNPTTH
jgi:arylsulfatase A-like enzyme